MAEPNAIIKEIADLAVKAKGQQDFIRACSDLLRGETDAQAFQDKLDAMAAADKEQMRLVRDLLGKVGELAATLGD